MVSNKFPTSFKKLCDLHFLAQSQILILEPMGWMGLGGWPRTKTCNRTWGDRTTLLFWSWSWFCLHHHLVGGALLLITKMLHGSCAGLIMEAHHTWRWRHIIMAKEVLALMVWGGWNAGRQLKEQAAKCWKGDLGSSKRKAAIEVGSGEFGEAKGARE